MKSNITEPLKVGQTVTIHNQSLGGQPVIEGEAKLKKLQSADSTSEYWTVKFKSDGFVTERTIPVDYNPTTEETRTRAEKGWK